MRREEKKIKLKTFKTKEKYFNVYFKLVTFTSHKQLRLNPKKKTLLLNCNKSLRQNYYSYNAVN